MYQWLKLLSWKMYPSNNWLRKKNHVESKFYKIPSPQEETTGKDVERKYS